VPLVEALAAVRLAEGAETVVDADGTQLGVQVSGVGGVVFGAVAAPYRTLSSTRA